MSESLALFRLAIVKNRLLLSVMIPAVLVGMVMFWVTVPTDVNIEKPQFAFIALFWALVPAAFATILLFDYGADGDMNLPDSGCNHWLLRMPIEAWKIALPPIVLKTIWASGLWVLLVVTLRGMGVAEKLPIFAPCLAFSGSAIWLLIISWRPFRGGWQRIVALVIAAPIMYCMVLGSAYGPYIDRIEWRPTAVLLGNVAAIVYYALAVWVTVRSVEMARVAPLGLIPASGARSSSLAESESDVRYLRGPWHALLHKDWIKTRRGVFLVTVAASIPTIVICTLFVPINVVSVIFVFIGFAYYGGIAVGRTGGPEDNPPHLEVYLAAAPIKTSTLAWSRVLSVIGIVGFTYAFILLVFVGWSLWPENRATWVQWAQELPSKMQVEGDAISFGIRTSIAITLGWTVFFLSRLASYVWIALTGRPWVAVVMAFAAGLAILIPLGIFLAWFMQQTDWDSTRQRALEFMQWAPVIVGGWLTCKLVMTIATSSVAWSRRIVTVRELMTVIGGWFVLVLVVGTTLAFLIPDTRATWLWCVSLTAIAVPLMRILLAPLAMDWNRHR